MEGREGATKENKKLKSVQSSTRRLMVDRLSYAPTRNALDSTQRDEGYGGKYAAGVDSEITDVQ